MCEINQLSASVHEKVEGHTEEDEEAGKNVKMTSKVAEEVANTPGKVEGTREESDTIDNEDEVEDSEDEDGWCEDDDDDDDAYEFISDDLGLDDLGTDALMEESSPFLSLNMGQYTLHPRLRSLNKSQIDEDKDPVNEHISVAEALFREDLRVAIQ